jgi:hypothetical protein
VEQLASHAPAFWQLSKVQGLLSLHCALLIQAGVLHALLQQSCPASHCTPLQLTIGKCKQFASQEFGLMQLSTVKALLSSQLVNGQGSLQTPAQQKLFTAQLASCGQFKQFSAASIIALPHNSGQCSTILSQFSSTLLPQTSIALGLIKAFLSLQSFPVGQSTLMALKSSLSESMQTMQRVSLGMPLQQ